MHFHIKPAARFLAPYFIAFCIMLTYGIVKSPIDSLFLHYQSATRLPIVWILVMIAIFVAIKLLNHFSSRHSMLRVFTGASIASVFLLLVFCGLFYGYPILSVYALAIWKEVYIVVLIEVFFSFLNLLHSVKAAKWAYGIMLACGSMGNALGNFYVSGFVKSIGSMYSLYSSIPVFMLIIAFSLIWYRLQQEDRVLKNQKYTVSQFSQVVGILRASKYLALLFCLVVLSQVAATLVEYELNSILAILYNNVDERSQVLSTIEAAINSLSFIMQIIGAFVFRFFGIGGTFVGIPLVLISSLVLFIVSAQTSTIILTRITGKIFDYSLLRTAKEILYIPLSRPEKTHGKAMIDIFAYRMARGFCSVLLLGLTAIEAGFMTTYCSLGIMIAWAMLAIIISTRFKEFSLVHEAETSSEDMQVPR